MTIGDVSSVFSFEVRLLACPNCGAPQTVPPAGGIVPCAHCRMSSEYRARPPAPASASASASASAAAAAAAAAAESVEEQRLARLREQVTGKTSALAPVWPAALAPLVAVRGIERRLAALDVAWKSAGRAARANPGSDEAAHLYVLAVGLAILARRAGDRRRERLVLETSLELARDPRQASVLRGMLVEAAARAGELAEARAWLASCDGRSADLAVDTEFRIASAFIARATNDPAAVLASVGATSSTVPIAPHRATLAGLCRVYALEELGRPAEAERELLALGGQYGGKHLRALGAIYPELDRARVNAAVDAQGKRVVAAAFVVIIGVVGATSGAVTGNPLYGVYAGAATAALLLVWAWRLKPRLAVFGYEPL